MIYLFNATIVCILGLVLFLGLKAIRMGLVARSKIKRAKPKPKRKRKK